jgi:hypothetical protein
MAGAGFKDFTAGEVLTAADVDTYLMEQSVMVFAGTAARSSAIASPSEGMLTYRTDEGVIEVYDGSAFVPAAPAAGAAAMTNRNLLYNGAMQVHQRGVSVSGITTGGYYTADRWNMTNTSLGTWTQTIENDAPTGSGLQKSLKVLCTAADAAPAASDLLQIQQRIEGQDLQRIAKGTSAAQQITLSFWVKSNVTGTYVADLLDVDNTRQTSISYTISASATWEKKTITFAADTTGAFDNDNGDSFRLSFWLGAGSNFTSGTLSTTWQASTAANRAVGQTNLASATNNYWQITGVQLEVGPVATPFEFKSYGTELAECQRYYFKTFNQETKPAQAAGNAGSLGGSSAVTNVSFVSTQTLPVTMRSAPTVTTYQTDGASSNWGSQAGAVPTATVLGWSGNSQVSIRASGSITAGGVHSINLTADAEL